MVLKWQVGALKRVKHVESARFLVSMLWACGNLIACDGEPDASPAYPIRTCQEIACGEDDDCDDDLKCNASGQCVACLVDADCDDDPNGSRCGDGGNCQCASDNECEAPLGLCRSTGCVCSEDTACAGEGAERCELGVCIACEEDDQCGLEAGGTACYAPGEVEAYCGCGADDDCSAGTPHCNATAGLCICQTDEECKDGELGVACIGGACVPCARDKDCVDAELGTACDVASGTCLECKDDEGCRDLGLGSRCVSGVCACDDASDCTADPSEPGGSFLCAE